eukprot:6210719-Pleurochrysis_carterae.AAC.7
MVTVANILVSTIEMPGSKSGLSLETNMELVDPFESHVAMYNRSSEAAAQFEMLISAFHCLNDSYKACPARKDANVEKQHNLHISYCPSIARTLNHLMARGGRMSLDLQFPLQKILSRNSSCKFKRRKGTFETACIAVDCNVLWIERVAAEAHATGITAVIIGFQAAWWTSPRELPSDEAYNPFYQKMLEVTTAYPHIMSAHLALSQYSSPQHYVEWSLYTASTYAAQCYSPDACLTNFTLSQTSFDTKVLHDPRRRALLGDVQPQRHHELGQPDGGGQRGRTHLIRQGHGQSKEPSRSAHGQGGPSPHLRAGECELQALPLRIMAFLTFLCCKDLRRSQSFNLAVVALEGRPIQSMAHERNKSFYACAD